MELKEFKYYLGETIMYCQIIEHDVKYIYAAMLSGDFNTNLNNITTWTLGETVRELEFLDKDKLFSKQDYKLLKEMTRKRNHWCHQTFLEFGYCLNPKETQAKYHIEQQELIQDHLALARLWKDTQMVRVKALKIYRNVDLTKPN